MGTAERADARQHLVGLITSCWQTQALRAAARLDLPDLLASGPSDAATLATACGSVTDPLQRLLRALCTLGICRERRNGRFVLTEAGQWLRREPPGGGPGLRAMALWWGGPLWPVWAGLDDSVRSGRSARLRRTGRAHYAFLDQQPAMAAAFHEAMRSMTALVAEDVAALPTWTGARSVVDVGGGHGELAAAIAARHPALQVSVLDRPDAEAGALAVMARRGLASRSRFVAGDFFDAVPPGADRYLLKSIVHNWDDAACGRLIARCAEAAPRGARLLLVERLRPARLKRSRHDEALARTDLNMLVGLGGRERSLGELAALLESTGFKICGTAPTRQEFSVIESERC